MVYITAIDIDDAVNHWPATARLVRGAQSILSVHRASCRDPFDRLCLLRLEVEVPGVSLSSYDLNFSRGAFGEDESKAATL